MKVSCANMGGRVAERALAPGGGVMKLIDMTISDGSVRMLYATQATKDDAEQWIEFKVNVKDARLRRTAEVQMQAILQIRAAFDNQMEQIRREAQSG
jgi:hypothetical protein